MKAILTQRRVGGFSLIELLISVVIGMLALMFATRIVVGGERGRQGAVGTSDSMQNGMLAMFSIRGDAEQAGFGLNDPMLVGCNTLFSDTAGYVLPVVTRGTANVTPLATAVIQPGATSITNGDRPDTISLFSGSAMSGSGSLRLNSTYQPGKPVQVDKVPYGFRRGDVVVLTPETPDPANNCALAQISSDPEALGAPPAAQTIGLLEGPDYRFNRSDLNATFKMGTARMFNLGPAKSLSFHTWSVDDGFLRLQATNLGADSAALAPAPVLDNIVSIKAQYGFDTRAGVAFAPGDGVVIKEWSSSMINADNAGVTGDAGDYQRITALRIAVVARSKVPERPQPGQACVAQVPDPRWIFTAKEPSTAPLAKVMVDLTVPGDTVDWKCYRYRTFESVIPLRNSAWRP